MQALPGRSKRKESVSNENSWRFLRLWSYSKASKGICPRKQQLLNSFPLSPWSCFPKPPLSLTVIGDLPRSILFKLKVFKQTKEGAEELEKHTACYLSSLFRGDAAILCLLIKNLPSTVVQGGSLWSGKIRLLMWNFLCLLKKSSMELSVKQTFQSGRAAHTPQDTSWAGAFRKCKWCGWCFMEW